jgi:hypothetical protein
MTLTRRQKLTLFLLFFYWVGIFILAHIPIPKLVYKAQVSDKALHFLIYLILVFLFWFAINPSKKVNWRKASVWWVFLITAVYAIIDELLQGYVGRSCDAMDFSADLVGAFTGLILFSFFTFLPAFLIVIAVSIFLLTNLAKANLAELVPVTNLAFHLFAYAFFSLVWIQIMSERIHLKSHRVKWLTVALALPTALLLTVKLSSIILGRNVGLLDILISIASIASVVATIFLTALFRRRLTADLTTPSG